MSEKLSYSPVWDASYAKHIFVGSSWMEKKAVRRAVFRYTCEAIARRGVRRISNDHVVEFPLVLNDWIPSTFYSATVKPAPVCVTKQYDTKTKIEVVNQDCLDAAQELMAQTDEKPLVLNMASPTHPGGGVANGAGAQEENLCRRSDYVRSLFSYSALAEMYPELDIKRDPSDSYPLDERDGAIYSEGITVFRGNESSGYPFLREPFELDFIAVAALNLRGKSDWTQDGNGNYQLSAQEREITAHKIRLMLRIAYETRHRCLVLSAFGCGAFCNPAREIARLFAAVLQEPEFKGAFTHIVFAIIEDHNSYSEINPEGNYRPFKRILEK